MSYLQTLSEWSHQIWLLALNHLWQATLFFIMALLASFFLRNGPARARYMLWLAASIKFAVPSVIIILMLTRVGIDPQSFFSSSPAHSTPTLRYITPVVSPIVIPASYLQPATNPSGLSASRTSPQTQTAGTSLALAGFFIWLVGIALFFLRWLKRRQMVSHAIKEGKSVSFGREWDALAKVKSWLGITRRLQLIVTTEIREPGVWGVLSPKILLPEAISDQLSDEELETLMLHEMAHVTRWDNLVSNLNMVLCCIFWFNPILWLIDKWLLKEREEACDDVVLIWSGAGDTYASSIRKVYRFCLNSHISGLSAAGGSKLKQRLDRILNNQTHEQFSVGHKFLLTLVVLSSVVLTILTGLSPAGSVVARTNSVLREAVSDFQQQIASSKAKECADTRVQPCERTPVTAISAQSALGQVVVRAAATTPLQTGIVATTNVNERQGSNIEAPGGSHTIEPAPSFQSAHANDLKRFTGRYAVDPGIMENFVLDVTLEDGELWLKPSHSSKRRLVAQSIVEYVDSKSPNTRITFSLDSMGNVDGLTLRGWGPTIVASRLVLPPPSRQGNITFKIDDYSDARIVAVAGTFNAWNQSQYLFEREGNEWVCRINLPPGKYQYKFIVDGNWFVDPHNPTVVHDRRGFENSELVVH